MWLILDNELNRKCIISRLEYLTDGWRLSKTPPLQQKSVYGEETSADSNTKYEKDTDLVWANKMYTPA